jgi:DNA-binding CsgD family transcriptional regulator
VRPVALATRRSDGASRPADLLLDGLALAVTDGYAAAAPVLRRAVSAVREAARDEQIRWLWLACRAAVSLWDDEAWDALSALHLRIVRDAGALSELPVALSTRIAVAVNLGDLSGAASLSDEQRAVSEAMGSHLVSYGALLTSAWRGDERTFTELAPPTTVTAWWRTVLFNGLGRFEAALEAGGAGDPERMVSTWVLPELIEAAAKSGDIDRAADALERFTAIAQASGSDWALGMLARSRALVSGDEAFFVEALERLGRTRIRAQLARTHLLYGEFLRGEAGRGADAREQLRTAFSMLSDMGIDGFAARSGETAPRGSQAGGELTAQEAQIARLAREGLSNPEIGARLFISPRTVEYHLHKVFSKLGIRSRAELPAMPRPVANTPVSRLV